jgi:hypothetical protein
VDIIFWKLATQLQSKHPYDVDSSIILYNLHYWISLSQQPSLFTSVLEYWKLLYPFLFIADHNDRLLILDIIHISLQGKKPHATAVICALALTSLLFFILEPSNGNSGDELKKRFLDEPESDRTSSLFRAQYISGDENMVEKYRGKLSVIITNLCRDERVADQVLRHSLDIILSSHMDSRLRMPQRGMFVSTQIQAQVNFPLHEYSNLVDLLNEYMPCCGVTKLFELTHLSIPYSRREELLKKVDPEWKPTIMEPAVTKSKATLLSSLIRDSREAVEDQQLSTIRARGIVMVNPKKVQLRLKSKHEKKIAKKDNVSEIIERNELYALELIAKCGYTNRLAQLLSKRLNVAFVAKPSYEQYSGLLPKKPMNESDVFYDKLFFNYPIFYQLLSFVAKKGTL